jgi:hypothetical protein
MKFSAENVIHLLICMQITAASLNLSAKLGTGANGWPSLP